MNRSAVQICLGPQNFKIIIMSDFKSRLNDEKVELDSKIEKLDSFLKSDNVKNIDSIQFSLLNVQSQVMKSYSQILLARIELLN